MAREIIMRIIIIIIIIIILVIIIIIMLNKEGSGRFLVDEMEGCWL